MGQDLIDRFGYEAQADNVRLRVQAKRWKELAKDLRARLRVVRRIAAAPPALSASRFPEERACSFCGTPRESVRCLVAGATVSICDACVKLATVVIAEADRPIAPKPEIDVKVRRRVTRKAKP